MITIHDLKQGSDEWHELRQGLYTGSNAHKLLKFGAIDYSLTVADNFKGNFWTKRGHILEEEAIELYEAIKKVTIDRAGFVTNSKYPSCGYSPDGLMGDRVIEVKCFSDTKHQTLFAGDIPLSVLAQCHFGMLICDKLLCDLIIYNPNLDSKEAFRAITIKANRNIQNNFKKILTKEIVLA